MKVTKSQLLRESVYEHLRAEILAGALPPGTDIEAAEVAARFKVSKSPVRDALMYLERENLVVTLPRQGYRVASISLSDVQDMFQLRAAMERACMERIVHRATDEELDTLDAFRSFDAQAWPGGFVAYNLAFHRHLSDIAKNARMTNQLADLMDQLERAVLVSLSNLKKSKPDSMVNEHCEIIDALQERRLKPAQRLIERHIGAAAKRVNDAISRIAVTE